MSHAILDREILPLDYSICRNDRSSRGGGVLLAIHNSIPYHQIEATNELEIIIVEILTEIHFCLCAVYIPPNSAPTYHTALLIYLEKLLTKYDNVIMVGDFNFGDINWQTLSAEGSVSDAFCDFVFNNNLEQLIQSPTHCLGNILDLVITNCSSLVDSPTVMSTGLTDTCDHRIITFNIQTCLPSRCV